jgi:DNA-binding transcriptional MerR regulator
MYLGALRETLHDEFGIPARTLQWYISEGLVPAPDRDGREGFYNLDEVDIVHFVCALRMMNREFDLPLKRASEMLRRYQQNLQRLVALLGGLAEEYPVQPFPADHLPGIGDRNMHNRYVRRRFFKHLAEGVDLEQFSVTAIDDQLSGRAPRQPTPSDQAAS